MIHTELLCVSPGSSRAGCWVKPERTLLGETLVSGWWHHLTKIQVSSCVTGREASLGEAS